MEGYWHLGAPSGPLATAMQIFSVLADLTELSFTAEFTEVRWGEVELSQSLLDTYRYILVC